jgi:acetyl-CoA acetyltransferase
MNGVSGNTAIVGVGEADIVKNSGKSALELAANATAAALEDSGLELKDIDGISSSYSIGDPYRFFGTVVAEYLGIKPSWLEQVNVGGSVAGLLIEHAALAVEAGLCNTVLCVWADSRASSLGAKQTVSAVAEMGSHPSYELPYGPTVPSLYALVANRFMHEYGLTREQLADVAVAMRAHAVRHPNALMKEPITRQDVIDSPQIATPLRRFDCCLISDYGAAVIVTRRDRSTAGSKKPVWLLGAGEGSTHEFISQAPSLTHFGSHASATSALQMAKVGLSEIDVAYLYDCFTITVLALLEDIGFCGRGEAGAFVEAGHIGPGGDLPVNTNGGLLSYSNGALLHVVEAVRQLRGEAGDRQVDKCETALVHLQGGVLSTHSTLILGSR